MTSVAEEHKSLQDAYKELRRQSSKTRKSINALTEEKALLSATKAQKDRELEYELQRSKEDALANKLSSVKQDFSRRKVQLLSELDSVKKEYNEKLASCSEDAIYGEYKSKEDFTEEVTSAMNEVVEVIQNDIGERFVDEYVSQLETKKVKLEKDEILSYVDRFYSLRDRFSKFSKKSTAGFSNKLEESLKKFTEESLGNDVKKTLLFAVVLVVLLIFTSRIVFLFYTGFLAYLVINNVIKGATYSKTLVECKVVADNINVLEDLILDEVKQESETRTSKVRSEYEPKVSELSEAVSSIDGEEYAELRKVSISFVFDDTLVMNKFDREVKEIDTRLENVDSEIEQLSNSNKDLLEKLAEINSKLENSLDVIKLEYLDFDRVGDQTIMSYEFLLDIKEDENRPVFFTYPRDNSCVFLYDDEEDVKNLISLLSLQLRMRMKPDSLRIQVWDRENMGTDYLCFTGKEKNPFTVNGTKEEVDDALTNTHGILVSRLKWILKEAADLESYNKKMLELDSVAESYMFLFIIDPDSAMARKEDLLQIATAGPQVGIYSNFFVKKNQLSEDYVQLIKKCDKAFTLVNGDLTSKSPTYLLESLDQFGR